MIKLSFMKIAHIASEYYPYVKTGGLADVVAALAGGLAKRGQEVSVFLPAYRALREHSDWAQAEKILEYELPLGEESAYGEIWRGKAGRNLTFYLVHREEYFDRTFPYGTGRRDYEDNFDRFLFFTKAVIETIFRLRLKLDIVHAHDWPTALLPVLLRWEEQRRGNRMVDRTVFTFHNLAFQGIFPLRLFERTGLPDALQGMQGLEFYGQMNWLKGGMLFADKVTTVSGQYRQETLTPAFGCGLDGVLASRGKDFIAIRNGIDQDLWNPATDPHLPASFSVSDLAGKDRCREALLKEFGWGKKCDEPVFGMICRLTEQKGIDLVEAVIDWFTEEEKGRLILLGSGDEEEMRKWENIAAAHPRRVAFRASMDERLAHLIEAGADFFLMPSRFEPCGLNQMYSQRYGTIPLVGAVGGLIDTVKPLKADATEGDGWIFPAGEKALREALDAAAALYRQPELCKKVRQRIMGKDFGWSGVLDHYLEIYTDLLKL